MEVVQAQSLHPSGLLRGNPALALLSTCICFLQTTQAQACRKSLELLTFTPLIKITQSLWQMHTCKAAVQSVGQSALHRVHVSCLIQTISGTSLFSFRYLGWGSGAKIAHVIDALNGDMEFWSGLELKQVTLYTLLNGLSLCQYM